MQTEHRQQFRLNPQVLAIVALALVALALPVAFVVMSLLPAREPKPSPPPAGSEVSAPLRKTLEDIADKNLAQSGWDELSVPEVRLETDHPERELARVEALTKTFDGIALPASRDGSQIRLRVSVAGNRAGDFLRACTREESAGQDAKSTDPARTLMEVVILPKSLP